MSYVLYVNMFMLIFYEHIFQTFFLVAVIANWGKKRFLSTQHYFGLQSYVLWCMLCIVMSSHDIFAVSVIPQFDVCSSRM